GCSNPGGPIENPLHSGGFLLSGRGNVARWATKRATSAEDSPEEARTTSFDSFSVILRRELRKAGIWNGFGGPRVGRLPIRVPTGKKVLDPEQLAIPLKLGLEVVVCEFV